MRAAMMKSLRCKPPILCIHQLTVTFPHSVRNAGRGILRLNLFSDYLGNWSVRAAMMKSLRCNPPILWVHQLTVTFPHSVRMAG